MKYQLAKDILLEGWMYGVNSVKFNWKGESTLNPNYLAVTKLAREISGGSTYIDRIANTNFKFDHNNDDIFQGLCNLTKVKVSYDSFNPEVFNAQRGGGDYALITSNIDKFYNYWCRKDTVLVIQAIRTSLNKDEDLFGEVRKRWSTAELSIRNMVEGRVEKDLCEFREKERDFSRRRPCLQAFVRLIFNHKGEAFPCCPDTSEKYSLGNIQYKSFWDLFNGAKAKMLRKQLKNGCAFRFEPCLNCSSFESFKGFKPSWQS